MEFYISYEAYAFFQQAVADKGTEGNYNKDLKEVTYLGYPVYPTSGIPNSADAIVFTYPDNIVVGTNAYTGNEAANLIPAYQYDGSDNVKVTMNFAVGVNVAVAADGVVGFDSAHKAAAELAETEFFISVDGDNILHESSRSNTRLDQDQSQGSA